MEWIEQSEEDMLYLKGNRVAEAIIEAIGRDPVLQALRERKAEIYSSLIPRYQINIDEQRIEPVDESEHPALMRINEMVEDRIRQIVRVNTPPPIGYSINERQG